MIRLARTADLDALCALLRDAHAGYDYPCRVDEIKARGALVRFQAHADALAVVSDPIHAVLLASVEAPWYSRERIASEWLFYSRDGSGPALLRWFMRWAKEKGAREVVMTTSTGDNAARTALFYEHLGLPVIGTVHRATLEN